eukprot:COSAG02_NODE_709_length_18217_cov_13.019704_14_plen_141_part_00
MEMQLRGAWCANPSYCSNGFSVEISVPYNPSATSIVVLQHLGKCKLGRAFLFPENPEQLALGLLGYFFGSRAAPKLLALPVPSSRNAPSLLPSGNQDHCMPNSDATSPFDKSVHRFSNTGILTDSEIDLFFRFRIDSSQF